MQQQAPDRARHELPVGAVTSMIGPCPLCGATEGTQEDSIAYDEIWAGLVSRHGLSFSDAVRAAHMPTETADLYRCAECRLSYFWPAIPGDADFWAELNDADGYPGDRWDFRWAAPLIERGDAVCDIGCGSGYFLNSVATVAGRRVGVDQAPSLIRQLRDQGIEAYGEELEAFSHAHAGEFDVVSAFQVVEHLTEVSGFVSSAVRLLAPGGRLIVSVPNRSRYTIDSLQALDCPPHHISRWTIDQLHELGRRGGLRVERSGREPMSINTPLASAVRRAASSVLNGRKHSDAAQSRSSIGSVPLRDRLVGHSIAAVFVRADQPAMSHSARPTANSAASSVTGSVAGSVASSAAEEIAGGQRFAFGANWRRFLDQLDGSRIERATESLRADLGRKDLSGLRFLDAGSGSGLFSLAAHRLGATVESFDFDPESVACTEELRSRFGGEAGAGNEWQVRQGSVLDAEMVHSLGQFDVVYSWGVLHHTGSMWAALDTVQSAVAPGGTLVIALYNDQGWRSRGWHLVKRSYCAAPKLLRLPILAVSAVLLWTRPAIADLTRRRASSWSEYGAERGMDPIRDLVDWVGGYPFEVASPEAVHRWAARNGFAVALERLADRRSGCNEFVLRRKD